MSVLSREELKKLELKYKLRSDIVSNYYRTIDNLVLKKFLYNSFYKKIQQIHDFKFVDYLSELSKVDEEFLVVPNDIYMLDKNHVLAYSYEYQYGTSIDGMYPRTKVDGLINALDKFFCLLEKMDYMHLSDIHPKDIVYDGNIKICNLDMCIFSDDNMIVENNIRLLNSKIFQGVFDVSITDSFEDWDKYLISLYESMINGEIKFNELIKEYRDYLVNNYGTCKYVKDLKRNVVSSSGKIYKSR